MSGADGGGGQEWGGAAVEGAGEVAVGFGEQVPVAEAAAVMDGDNRSDRQSRGRNVDGGADGAGGEVGQGQEVVDDRFTDAAMALSRQRARRADRGWAVFFTGRVSVVARAMRRRRISPHP
ncbi:hypothetical protein [Streptomyces sp. NPDC057429]|uniref:hypothetical protein n=1 Tax=Streptomyces sp. NPDC057429 TaxID=3346130 RepID=UPI00369F81EF